VVIHGPKLYPKQFEAIFAPERYACIEASTKAGKTFGCLIWQLHQVLSHVGHRNHVWCAPVYVQARVAYDRAKQMLPVQTYTKNDGDLTLTFPNQAKWFFRSAERPDSLYSDDYWSAVLDEASRMREESWHAIRSTITKTRGQCRLIGNVKGRKNFFYMMSRKAQGGEPDYSYSMLTAWDAVEGGVLARQEIHDAQRDLPDQVFKELYLCQPADNATNPFGLDAIRRCLGSVAGGKPFVYGIDLAKSHDWTVIIGLGRDGNVCYYDRFQKPWQDTIKEIERLKGAPALIDSTGVGDPIVESVQRTNKIHAEGFKFTSGSKQQIMEGLAVAIQRERIRYPEEVARELELFEYEYSRMGVKYSAPPGAHDDCVCALALAVEMARRMGGLGVDRPRRATPQAPKPNRMNRLKTFR